MTRDVPLTVLTRALDQAESVIGGIAPEQLGSRTPCDDWDVQRLLAHLVAAPARFTEMNQGGHPDWSRDEPVELGEAAAAFRANADGLLDSWRSRGDDADTSLADWQTAEMAVHTWDLATATGQPADLDSEVAERGLAFMSKSLTADNRGEAFGPEVAVASDAPVYDRLAAWAGRAPAGQRRGPAD